ncbi:MAG: NERD domain-containing protein [Gammaproteobacteria bacterium]|nr:NERD domain-containing protein [Gammaproteobacteria bacterium]MDH5692848.1 NERD domain-containing protein [Gammaproteobacteria bacterium]
MKEEAINYLNRYGVSLEDQTLDLAALIISSILLFALLVLFFVKRVKLNKDQRQLHKVIKSVSKHYMRDIFIPDGLGGFKHIDYVVLTPAGIAVITAQDFPGILFGGEKVDLWTQVVQSKSYKFNNPLPYNRECVQAVKLVSDLLPVIGRTTFTSAGTFPKGIPETVSLTHTLKEDLLNGEQQSISDDMLAKWRSFKDDLYAMIKPMNVSLSASRN